jgi:hypothetical protein
MGKAIPPLPQYAFMAWCSFKEKAKGQLYFYLLRNKCASFEAFTAVMSQVEVFWVVTPCGVVVGYQRFREPCCHPDGGSKVL